MAKCRTQFKDEKKKLTANRRVALKSASAPVLIQKTGKDNLQHYTRPFLAEYVRMYFITWYHVIDVADENMGICYGSDETMKMRLHNKVFCFALHVHT